MKKTLIFLLSFLCITSFCSCGKKATSPQENSAAQTHPSESLDSDEYIVYKSEETGLFGYTDKDGNIIIECQYERAKPFSEGLAVVELNNRFAYIDETGTPVTGFNFTSASKFSNGLAVVGNEENKLGYIDKSGNIVIDYKYDTATSFNSQGIATVISNDRAFTIDKSGNEVIAEDE